MWRVMGFPQIFHIATCQSRGTREMWIMMFHMLLFPHLFVIWMLWQNNSIFLKENKMYILLTFIISLNIHEMWSLVRDYWSRKVITSIYYIIKHSWDVVTRTWLLVKKGYNKYLSFMRCGHSYVTIGQERL
jgi:hypothetical protein